MSNCISNLTLIKGTDTISSSLPIINNNFNEIKSLICDVETLLNTDHQVRTFFYYGPNTSDYTQYDDGSLTRPSDYTITTFLNTSLNLPTISEDGDIAYVIYQKTGYRSQSTTYTRSGTGYIPYSSTEGVIQKHEVVPSQDPTKSYWVSYTTNESLTKYAPYTWTTTVTDNYYQFSPTYVIYRLTYDGITEFAYTMDIGYPKFTNAVTADTNDWNKPQNWTTY